MGGREIEQIIDKYDRLLATSEDAVISRVNAALDAAYKRLEAELLKSYAKYSGNTSLLPNQRKLLILDELGTLLQLLNTRNSEQIQQDLENLLKGSYDNGVKLADELVKAISNEQLQSFASVNLDAVQAQARDGMKRLGRHSEEFASRASAIVEMHLATGSGVRKVARALRAELGIAKGRAETIARTETLSALNTASQQRYKELGVEYIRWVATASDRRTCPLCSARNGNVYELGAVMIPGHPRCRCTSVPWKKEWSKLGLSGDDWASDFHQQGIAELSASGKQPDYGLSPFERYAGLTEPVKPAYTLDDLLKTG